MPISTFVARDISHAAIGTPVFPLKVSDTVARPIFRATNQRKVYHEFHDRTETIFLHIPKTAGTSVLHALYDTPVVGHPLLIEYYLLDQDRFSRYWKFSIVRNPFDRLVSSYHFVKRGGGNAGTGRWAERHLGKCKSFAEFVDLLADDSRNGPVLYYQHFRPQTHFLTGVDGKIGVDYVGKLEDIDAVYAHIRSKVRGSRPELEKRNTSERGHYKNYYTPEARKIVEKIYASDLETFGYDFR